MKVVRISQLEETRAVRFTGGISYRAVIEKDNIGFSVHKTVIPKGGPYHWHYPNHLEACYCIKGAGIIKSGDFSTMITPDCVYLLDKHDDHTFEALEDTVLISVFNPPVSGSEKHDENGHYPPAPYLKSMAEKLYSAVNESKSKCDAIELITEILLHHV